LPGLPRQNFPAPAFGKEHRRRGRCRKSLAW
jgi:hypothetical protein